MTDRAGLITADSQQHAALRLWLRLFTCSHLIEGGLSQRFRREFDISLARFDVLSHLERHRDGMRMTELSRRLMVTGGNVTGLVDQLVAEGFAVRERVASDRRSSLVRITTRGLKEFSRMAQVHESWIVEILAPLSDADVEAGIRILGKLRRALLTPTDEPAG